MAEIPALRQQIQIPETQFRAAVSESTWQKIGGSINFINTLQKYDKGFFVNGGYGVLSMPFLGLDGLFVIPDNFKITNVAMAVKTAGSSGSTTMDLKYATTPGGPFTSIFSTTPSINYSAGNYSWCYTGSSFANTTAPVLLTTDLNAGAALRCDILSVMGGTPIGAFLTLYMQPMN